MIRTALIQVAVTDDEPVADRTARVLEVTAAVALEHDLVVLPELWPIGAFAIDLVASHAQPLDGPICQALGQIAAATKTWVFGGSIPEAAAQGFANTAIVFGPDGTLVASYRKMHLFGFNGGESTVMTPGTDVTVFPSPLGPTGLATCYDLRFPELFRAQVDRGATAFVIPSGWPERRLSHWQVLARARAIENQCYVLACNQTGTHAGVPMAGYSMIVDPQGELIAEAGPGEQILSATLDPERVAAWRKAFPALDDRRANWGGPAPTSPQL
jgi:predicted amidohydrolase